MKIAVMQPYLFPYIGYFKLVDSVDKFIFYEDVNFIKNGWINRNRILISGQVKYVTIPLIGASSNMRIDEVKVQPKHAWLRKVLASIQQSYCKHPFFNQGFDLVRDVLDSRADTIAKIAMDSVEKASQRIGIDVNFATSAGRYGNEYLAGAERVIDICRIEKADEYLNLPGGRDLYSSHDFSKHGIDLKFIDVDMRAYPQIATEFIPGLSIIDVLMSIPADEARFLF